MNQTPISVCCTRCHGAGQIPLSAQQARVYRATGDRLGTTAEIAARAGLPPALAYYHLRTLRAAGLLRSRGRLKGGGPMAWARQKGRPTHG